MVGPMSCVALTLMPSLRLCAMRVRLASGHEVLYLESGLPAGRLKELLAERLQLPRFRQRLVQSGAEVLEEQLVEEEVQLVILDFWMLAFRRL